MALVNVKEVDRGEGWRITKGTIRSSSIVRGSFGKERRHYSHVVHYAKFDDGHVMPCASLTEARAYVTHRLAVKGSP